MSINWNRQGELTNCITILFVLKDDNSNHLRCMGTPTSFSAMFSKGDNFQDFLFAHLEDEVFQKWGLLL